MIAMLTALGLTVAGCAFKPAAPPAPPEDSCADADGPRPDTVSRAVAAVPPASFAWVETARGHTGNCRLYWVKLSLPNATPAGPEQLLFFDHDTPLGSPAPHPQPYTTVVATSSDAVIVQYQWRVDDDPVCCPTGGRTTRYQIGPRGTLHEQP